MTNYDEDHNDPRQFCKHGTFIGSWWGPDYLCSKCELGDPDPTPNQIKEERGKFGRRFGDAYEFFRNLGQPLTEDQLKAVLQKIQEYNDRLSYVRQFAENDDDCNWLQRAHDRALSPAPELETDRD